MGKSSNYYINQAYMAEGERGKDFAEHNIMFAALPDDSTVICMQLVKAQNRVHIFSVKGMFLQIPMIFSTGITGLFAVRIFAGTWKPYRRNRF